MEAKQETIEQAQINELKREVRKLSSMVDYLCSTNFLTEHQDGDEEFRKHAVTQVNRCNRRAVDDYKARMEHNELWMKQREIRDRMMLIEQDHPELRDNYEVSLPLPTPEESRKQKILNEYLNKQYYAQLKAGK